MSLIKCGRNMRKIDWVFVLVVILTIVSLLIAVRANMSSRGNAQSVTQAKEITAHLREQYEKAKKQPVDELPAGRPQHRTYSKFLETAVDRVDQGNTEGRLSPTDLAYGSEEAYKTIDQLLISTTGTVQRVEIIKGEKIGDLDMNRIDGQLYGLGQLTLKVTYKETKKPEIKQLNIFTALTNQGAVERLQLGTFDAEKEGLK